MKLQHKISTTKICLMAMFTAISVVAIALIRIPLIPAAPFLVYDMADIPIILATLLMGGLPGMAVLITVCLIQAFLMGGDGVIGFLMHAVSTGAMVLIFALFRAKFKSRISLVLAGVLATVTMTLIMIPMNLIFTGYFMGTPMSVVTSMLVPAIIPFNLIKAGLNCLLAIFIYKISLPIFKRLNKG